MAKQTIRLVDGGEEQTFCNICTRYVEIVAYNEYLDLAICERCKGNKNVIRHYVLSLLDDV